MKVSVVHPLPDLIETMVLSRGLTVIPFVGMIVQVYFGSNF